MDKVKRQHVLIQHEVVDIPQLRAISLRVTHMAAHLSTTRVQFYEQQFAMSRSMARQLRDALDRALGEDSPRRINA